MLMLKRFATWVKQLFDTTPVHLALVRRYADANGYYVGELYLYGIFNGIGTYRMIGVSLDSFPLACASLSLADEPKALDLAHDFLEPMEYNRFRVGAAEPEFNENVRKMIGKLKRKNIRIVIQNKFIEHVLEAKKI